MLKRKKGITIMLLLVICATMLLTTTTMTMAAAAEEDSNTPATLVSRAEKVKEDIVELIQTVAHILAVIFIAWAGVIFWGAGGNPQEKAAAKDKLIYFLIAVFMINTAQTIVNTIWGWLS